MFSLYIVLPFVFGYVGGRLKRHSIGLFFAFMPLILVLVIGGAFGGFGLVYSIVRGFGLVYPVVAIVGYIIGFRWKSLLTESKPS